MVVSASFPLGKGLSYKSLPAKVALPSTLGRDREDGNGREDGLLAGLKGEKGPLCTSFTSSAICVLRATVVFLCPVDPQNLGKREVAGALIWEKKAGICFSSNVPET